MVLDDRTFETAATLRLLLQLIGGYRLDRLDPKDWPSQEVVLGTIMLAKKWEYVLLYSLLIGHSMLQLLRGPDEGIIPVFRLAAVLDEELLAYQAVIILAQRTDKPRLPTNEAEWAGDGSSRSSIFVATWSLAQVKGVPTTCCTSSYKLPKHALTVPSQCSGECIFPKGHPARQVHNLQKPTHRAQRRGLQRPPPLPALPAPSQEGGSRVMVHLSLSPLSSHCNSKASRIWA